MIALGLEANPDLTWRDVQHILVRTSNYKHLKSNDWVQNGAGFKFSHAFGFGLIDALGVVKVAEVWKGSGEQKVYQSAPDMHHYATKMQTNFVIKRFTISENDTDVRYIEHVVLSCTMIAHRRGDVNLFLVSPSGTTTEILPPRASDRSVKGFSDWNFMTVHFWGEESYGTWKIEIYDRSDQNMYTDRKQRNLKNASIILSQWHIEVFGTSEKVEPSLTKERIKEIIESPSGSFKNNRQKDVVVPGLQGVNHENGKVHVDNLRKMSILNHSKNRCEKTKIEDFSYSPCHSLCHDEYGCCGPLASDCFQCKHAVSQNKEFCEESCPPDKHLSGPFNVCQHCKTECKTCSTVSKKVFF